MRRKASPGPIPVLVALVCPLLLLAIAPPLIADPAISEIRIDQAGADNDEYFELTGTPGASLDGLTYLVIGDSTGGGSGVIEAVVDLTGNSIPGSGFFVAAEGTFSLASANLTASLNFENSDNVTHLLVQGFSGASGDDLDTDDDGTRDSTPWTALVDCVALVETVGSGDQVYCGTTVGPDGSFVPAHVFLCPSGFEIGAFSAGGDDTPGSANNCAPPPPPVVSIMEIQGSGQFSPFDGEDVETSGVVTLFTANGSNCWLQDPDGDGDAATSDGIFVSGCAFPDVGPVPTVGDVIRIIAEVDEQQFGNALPLTRLRRVELIEVLWHEDALPDPVQLEDLPNESLVEGIDFWEPLEGMRVAVRNAPVVAPTSRFGEFALLTKEDAKPGSGFFPQTQQILLRGLGAGMVDYNPERILVDDGTLDEAILAMPGDRVRKLVGVVDYTFGNYKIQPASFDLKKHNLPRIPASRRSGGAGNTVITTFNVENLFDLVLNEETVLDTIGQVGLDPGSEWGTGDASTRDNTLRRKDNICQGDTDETDAFDPSVEWDGFPQDTFDGLGSHSVSCGTPSELFISEYVEGSSLNKAIEIFNGTGAPINLATAGYRLQIFFNGSAFPGATISLTGTVAAGDVYVLADDGAASPVLAQADQTSTLNFFNGDDAVVLQKGGKNDASSTPTASALETQLTKLALAVELELELPDILVVQEVENTLILQDLGNRVNAAAGTDYVAASFETSDARGIEVGFLWDADRVSLIEAFQLDDTIVPGVSAAFGPASPSPGREPLVGRFDINGYEVTVVGNHFKSKGGDDPLFGVSQPPVRVTETQRKAQAQVVRDYVDTILDPDPHALVVVLGDLNDFEFGEPGEGADHPLAILEGATGGVPLTNLVNLEKKAERFTFLFDGNSQVLDHILVSPALREDFVAVDILHFNAGFPEDLGEDDSHPLRASDHDAVESRFDIR